MTPDLAFEDFRRRLLRLDAGAENILEAAKIFPDDPHLLIGSSMLNLFGQTNICNTAGADFLDRAEIHGADAVLPGLPSALRLWHAQCYDAAATAFEEITRKSPHDLLAAKCAEFLYYVMGQQHTGARFLAHMERLAAANGADPDFLAMYSFAHELCGHFSEARALAERALEIEPRNPWAEHTLSHVNIRLGDIVEGEKRLRNFLPLAATCARMVHSHTAWHLALFDLEHLKQDSVLEIYRNHIWGFAPDMIVEQIDAIALLWRMEMAGVAVDAEWHSIADHVENHVAETFMPFLSAHHVYALTRAGRTDAAEHLLATIDAATGSAWEVVGHAVAHATEAFARQDWDTTANLLGPVMKDMTAIGGSDAQDDLFRQMYFTALARCGRKSDARIYWARFQGGKRPTPLDDHFLNLAA